MEEFHLLPSQLLWSLIRHLYGKWTGVDCWAAHVRHKHHLPASLAEPDGRGPGVRAALFPAEFMLYPRWALASSWSYVWLALISPRALKTWRDVLMFCSYGQVGCTGEGSS